MSQLLKTERMSSERYFMRGLESGLGLPPLSTLKKRSNSLLPLGLRDSTGVRRRSLRGAGTDRESARRTQTWDDPGDRVQGAG